MEKRFIPVAVPALVGNEKAYVMDCLESTWISSVGKYIDQFESTFSQFCQVKHALSCCNGTVALHLALLALGVGPGDEVIVPTLTFVATANAVSYCGARPVFVDSEPESWNLDAALIEDKITSRTRGTIVVHLFGFPVDMDAVLSVAQKYGLFVLEDAAEAHGAEYKGRRIGSLGNIATFSFYGNKIVTTGEGGMVVTDNETLAGRVRRLKGQGMEPDRRYWFPEIGYNYRMSNIAAAIGLAQMERVDWHIRRRREVAGWYRERFADVPGVILPVEKSWARNVSWMFSVVLGDDIGTGRDDVMATLGGHGIETRPVFYPMHVLPPYVSSANGQNFPVADRISSRGITLPTWAGLKREDVDFICEALISALGSHPRRSK